VWEEMKNPSDNKHEKYKADHATDVAHEATVDKIAEERLMLTQFSVDRSGDAAFWVRDDGHFFYVNEEACHSLGYSRDELLCMGVYDITPDVTRHGWADHFQELKEHGRWTFESRHHKRDGQMFSVEITTNVIRFNEREYVCAFARDITERKLAEKSLREARMQAELYLDLMGHDINNMHQIALGYLELLRDMHADGTKNEFIDKPIEVLHRSARLIQNVRKLQKLHEGMLKNQEVDVINTLSYIQREFGSIPGKTITLNLNGYDHIYIRANELLDDVFENLVSNAVRHTDNPAEITIDADRVVEGNQRCYRIIIEDDGPGIPDSFKDMIFNRMYKSSARGMGLGLYLVKSLVESYGGQVNVRDRIEGDHTKGAKFVVLLPSAEL